MLVNRLLANENNLNPTGFYKEDKSRFNLDPTSNNSDRNRPDFDKQQEYKAKSGTTYKKKKMR